MLNVPPSGARPSPKEPPLSIAGVNPVRVPPTAAAVAIAAINYLPKLHPRQFNPLRAPLRSALANQRPLRASSRPLLAQKERGQTCSGGSLRVATLPSARYIGPLVHRVLAPRARAEISSPLPFVVCAAPAVVLSWPLPPLVGLAPCPLPPSPLPSAPCGRCPVGGVMPPLCSCSAPLGRWRVAPCGRSSPRHAPRIRAARSPRPSALAPLRNTPALGSVVSWALRARAPPSFRWHKSHTTLTFFSPVSKKFVSLQPKINP